MTKWDSDVVHRAGVKNQAAHALSRIETSHSDNEEMEDYLRTSVVGTMERCIEEGEMD